MSIESKNLSFGDTAFTSDIPAIKSGWFHIWFSKLAVSVCVCMILELVLHLALPGSFLRNEELSLQVRLFLLSRTWVALTLWGLAIGGVLTLSARGLDYFAPANGYLRKLMQHALGFVFGLIVLLYVISWAVYWQLSKFLDRHSISFFAAQPLQVFHWVDADVALAVILIASPVTLLIGRWIPRWVEGKSPMAQRILSRIFCGVIGASCLWSLFGTLIIHKQDQRFIQGFIAEGLDQQMSPFVRALSDFRDYLNPGPGDFGVIETADPPPRPIVSMDQYLATVDRRKIRSWNVIVLTVESLRADILRAYGSTRDVMPTADALARDARVFVNAYAQASHTSYAALAPLSSHYPLRSTMQYTYPESMTYPRVLIYDVLKALGYHTAIFSSSNENWEGMIHYLQTKNIDKLFHAENFNGPTYNFAGDTGFSDWVKETKHAGSVDDRFTVTEAIQWIDQLNKEPFFLYVNFQNSHLPYVLPSDFPHRFGPKEIDFTIRFGHFPRDRVNTAKDLYADSLAYVDFQISRLFEHLRRKGLWEDTLIVLTGDHGQAFYEHGFSAHASQLFNEVMKVPLIIRAPGLEAGLNNLPAQHVDVPPSILALLGAPSHPSFQGISLFTGQLDRDRSIYMVAQTPLAYQYGIVRSHWKLIYDAQKKIYLLFDLLSDPNEARNVASEQAEHLKELAKHLNTWRKLQIDYYTDKSRHSHEYPPALNEDSTPVN